MGCSRAARCVGNSTRRNTGASSSEWSGSTDQRFLWCLHEMLTASAACEARGCRLQQGASGAARSGRSRLGTSSSSDEGVSKSRLRLNTPLGIPDQTFGDEVEEELVISSQYLS